MPPIEPPTTANSLSMPRWSTSRFCARTMSWIVTGGKSVPQGSRRVAVARAARPGAAHAAAQHIGADDEEFVGIDRPARPDHTLPPAGLAGHRIGSATYWSPVRAWQIRIALLRAAFSVP